MKLPFLRTDPDDTRRAAEAALAQTEAKIADLERDRAAALLTENYAGAVDAIDQQLEAQRRAIAVHQDRIAAMVSRRRADDRVRLEREKAERIADTNKRLTNLQAAAKLVDEATAALQVAVHNLDRADAAVFGDLSRSYLSTRSIAALADRAAGPRDQPGINEHRRIIGPLRKIANGAPYGLAAEVEDRGRRLIEFMESEPVADPEPSDEAEQAA
ncbi:hypothetical protein [Bradyrhizobium erythrophlei]|uniref:Uncharacterized protein n=1 Tax=Bradyrhizobium erythrophlei TaxID=1437360 RepID=A0A1M5SI86_9BRAD|nr:hypothetical protein [Bradyrhizobium erythrophlei]SHH38209.1 hypothetical protein SAMN05443248_4618 [Bradyrhizobium erythrophlei]